MFRPFIRCRLVALISMVVAALFLSDSLRRSSGAVIEPPAAAKSSIPKADPQPSASLTLERILKNWKASQERTKSLHITWDTRLPRLKRPNDRSSNEIGFRVLHNELWMEGESRSRIEQSFARGRGYQFTRFGQTHASCTWQFGSKQPSLGAIWSAENPPDCTAYEEFLTLGVNHMVGHLSMRAPWIFFRPFASDSPSQESRDFRIASEKELVGNDYLVKLAVTDLQKNTFEEFWVDPARGDIVVKWQWRDEGGGRNLVCSLLFELERDERNGWLPLRWTERVVIGRELLGTAVNTRTGFSTSEEYPRDAFQLAFPEGTVVFDNRTKEQYAIGKNETRTNVLKCGSPDSRKVFDALESPVEFSVKPQALKDALDFIAARYEIAIRMDQQALRKAGIDPNTEVEASISGAPLQNLLQLLLGQLSERVVFEIRGGALVIAPVLPRPATEKLPPR